MAPPCAYSDISKDATDLISKDYPVGSTKLEINTTSDNGIKFTINGLKDNATGKIASDIKAKYTDKERGLTITESWTTTNVLGAKVEADNAFAKGVKVDLDCSFMPEKGNQNVKAGLQIKNAHVFTRSTLDLFKGPTIFADCVVGHGGFLAGGETSYDVGEAKVTKYGFTLGYLAPLFSYSVVAANKLSLFTFSYHQKVSSTVEAGCRAVYNSQVKDSIVGIEVGSKVVLDKSSYFKAKVDNSGRLGLGFTQVLKEGVKLQFGGLFDTTKISADVHKLGLQLTFEG